MLQATTNEHVNENALRIKALEHLIEAGFDTQKSCHAVCHLVSQVLSKSDDDISRMMASVAQKALQTSVENNSMTV